MEKTPLYLLCKGLLKKLCKGLLKKTLDSNSQIPYDKL